MEILKSIQSRYSVRKYLSRPVEQEKIDRCLEAARIAPSACNGQPWKFIVINRPELVKKVSEYARASLLNMNKFLDQAPVIIAIVLEPANATSELGSKIKRKHYPLIDIGIAAEHICLQAVAEGLGSCMVGWLNEKKVKKLLSIPKSKRVPLLITLGYPDEGGSKKRNRKPFEKIISYNSY